MRVWRAPLAIWAIGGLFVACGGASTNDAPPADAGAVAPDDSGNPVPGPDSSSADTSVSEGGADASFCAKNPGHDFCEDFDLPVQIGGGRFDRPQVDESTARLLQENGSLRVDVLELDASAGTYAPAFLWLERSWPRLGDGTRPRVVLRYKLRVEECPASGVSGPSFMAGVDRGVFYAWTVETPIYFDVDCRMRGFSLVYHDLDGAPKQVVPTTSDFIAIPTKQWLDVVLDIKEQANNVVNVSLEVVGRKKVTFDIDEARSEIDVLSVLFGASKSTSANVSAEYLLDDLLLDHTQP